VNAEDLCKYESCPRRLAWSREYLPFRISPIGALYRALDAGLIGKAQDDAKSSMLKTAAMPGLDIEGADVYDIAVHLGTLANTIVAYLRGNDSPWKKVEPVRCPFEWESACYESPDGRLRRIVLVDRWTEERKLEEARSWRTIGEICALSREMLINAIVIGQSYGKRRVSHWARTFTHPKNHGIKFKKKTETLSASWKQVWREDWNGTTEDWLYQMQKDECFDDLVFALKVGIPNRQEEFVADMMRIGGEMLLLLQNPPMRRSGCFGFSPCPFLETCYRQEAKTPKDVGYLRYSDID
jgi:hypothetical protein